jgi:hypothetical protein
LGPQAMHVRTRKGQVLRMNHQSKKWCIGLLPGFLCGMPVFFPKCGKGVVFEIILVINVFLSIITQYAQPSYADDHAKKSLLIIHSYHQTSPWTDKIMLGILSILNKSDFLLDIHVEYLDVQRRPLGLLANDLENV